MINAVELNFGENNIYLDEVGGKLQLLPNLKHINVFVGANNSGKSRLLRSLLTNEKIILLSDVNCSNSDLGLVSTRLNNSFRELQKKDPRYHVCIIHDNLSPCEMYAYYKKQYDGYDLASKSRLSSFRDMPVQVNADLKSIYNKIIYRENGNIIQYKSIPKVYIPVLRGIENYNLYFDTQKNQQLDNISMNTEQRRAFEEYKMNAGKIYGNKTSKVYKIPEASIFTGENLYAEIRDKLLGEANDRQFIKEFESFISNSFFNGEGFTIIPIIKKGYLNVKIGNSEEHPLHNLGDGIKQVICLLYKAFEFKQREAFICIEEPEMNLHPGYQRKLIEILQKEEFSKLYFWITTHSNHIVDCCFDYDNISIYKFVNVNKTNNLFQVINTSPKDIGILNQLGVNNSSVFMSNSTIWVEGISDKIYLSKYLKTYIESNNLTDYKEGVDYAFVEYGGNNIVHWSFDDSADEDYIKASGITNRAFIVVDNDNDSNRKKKRKESLQLSFGDRYYELPVREIENTLGKKVIEKTLFEGNPIYKPGMDKKRESIETKSTFVWEYIDRHYQLRRKYWNPHSKQPTVSKLSFAKEACSRINSIDDLSDTAKAIAEKLYKFIDGVAQEINNGA